VLLDHHHVTGGRSSGPSRSGHIPQLASGNSYWTAMASFEHLGSPVAVFVILAHAAQHPGEKRSCTSYEPPGLNATSELASVLQPIVCGSSWLHDDLQQPGAALAPGAPRSTRATAPRPAAAARHDASF
jgi:hypothetical protein